LLSSLRSFFVHNGSVAGKHVHVAAVVKIVDSEGTFAAGFDREIAAGDAEIIVVCGVHVEGSGALAEDQTGGAGAIVQRKVVKLENRVFIEKRHRAILKLHLGAAVIRGQHVALTDGQIGLGRFPLCFLVGERVAMRFSCKAHIALD